MSGKSMVNKIHTNAVLLNAVLNAAVQPESTQNSGFVRRRRVLSEYDRTRTASANRRQDAMQEKFREVYRDRKLLVNRHREAIQLSDTKDLSSIVDIIEFTQTVDRKLLQTIAGIADRNVDQLKQLNDRQIGVLLSAGGKFADQVGVEARKEYVSKLWKGITSANVPINILTYNARIAVNIDNGVDQNVVNTLQELEDAGIEADENTFGILSKVYAMKGQTAGITQIIDILKEQNLPAPQQLFESLVYSIAFNGEEKSTQTVIHSLSANPAVNTADLYIAAALAVARKTKDVDKVVKLLMDVPHSVAFKRKENLPRILNLIVVLLESGATGVVAKLRPYVYLDQTSHSLPLGYNSSGLVRTIHQFFRQKNEAAAVELFSLIGGESKSNLRNFFEESLYQNATDYDKAIQLANLFRESKVLYSPLTKLIDKMIYENLSIFPVYNAFLKSPEFEELKDRKHLLWPRIASLIKNISELKSDNKAKNKLLKELLPLMEVQAPPSGIGKQLSTLFTLETHSDENMKLFLDEHREFSRTIVSSIVYEFLYDNQLMKLESLLAGPLAGETLYLKRMLSPILRLLKFTKLTDAELRAIASVISAGFPVDGTSFHEGFAFSFIRDIITSKSVSDERIEALFNILAENPRVSLSADEIKKIEELLNNNGSGSRVVLMKGLRRKSTTLLRWIKSDTEELEREVQFCESADEMKEGAQCKLYEVLLSKYAAGKTPANCERMFDLIQKYIQLNPEKQFLMNKYIVNALPKAFQAKNASIAEALWGMMDNHNDSRKLSYCLFLLENGQNEKATEVLLTMKKTPLDFLILRAIQDLNARFEVVEKFIEILSGKFSITPLTRRRLITAGKNMEIRQLINQNKLEEAFKISESMTNMHNVAFGQNDLMAGCVRNENPEMLKNVFKMVVEKHGRLSGLIDMMVAFLECGKQGKAEQLYKGALTSGFTIGSAKLEYLTGRETELNRPDVLHDIFVLVNDPDHVSTADLTIMLEKVVTMYAANGNLDRLTRLKSDVEKVRFTLDRNLKTQLEAAIDKLSDPSKAAKKEYAEQQDKVIDNLFKPSAAAKVSA